MGVRMVGDIRAFYATLIISLIAGCAYLYTAYEHVIFHGSDQGTELAKKRDELNQLKNQNKTKLKPLKVIEMELRNSNLVYLSDINIQETKNRGNSGMAIISGDVLGVIGDAMQLQKDLPIKYKTVEYNGQELKLDFEYYGIR